MDKSKRKELLAEWKERHPEMGIVSVKCNKTNEEFYDIAKDISTWFNRHRFQLNANMHRNKRLQELWNACEENDFGFATVAEFEYENLDDVEINDLRELLEICLLENPRAKKI